MTEPLVVHLNRDDHRAIEPAATHFETSGPLVVRLQNHGEGSHVHLSLTGGLAEIGTIDDTNPFLDPEATIEIGVDADREHRPLSGGIEISTGYGQESTTVAVELVKNTRAGPETSTRVPESSGGTSSSPSENRRRAGAAGDEEGALTGLTRWLDDPGTIVLLVVAVVAVVAAVSAWQVLDGVAVKVGVVAVLATVVGAIAVALRRGGS